MGSERGRAWRAGEYLGLVSDKPKPKIGSQAWWLNVLFIGAISVVTVSLLTWLEWL